MINDPFVDDRRLSSFCSISLCRRPTVSLFPSDLYGALSDVVEVTCLLMQLVVELVLCCVVIVDRVVTKIHVCLQCLFYLDQTQLHAVECVVDGPLQCFLQLSDRLLY